MGIQGEFTSHSHLEPSLFYHKFNPILTPILCTAMPMVLPQTTMIMSKLAERSYREHSLFHESIHNELGYFLWCDITDV